MTAIRPLGSERELVISSRVPIQTYISLKQIARQSQLGPGEKSIEAEKGKMVIWPQKQIRGHKTLIW